jgi:phenylpropionate dioxygenase-like ring-hydroxylating dioxygenase large terminal subunit
MDDREQDSGTAYGLPAPSYNADLTLVSAGTACGEFLRRYWHPIGVSTDATDRPRPVRVLGEDLILFRDGGGRSGLVYPRCIHRGATLYYGRIEERGIRCCYHGWLFDVEGRCLEQPCEPEAGKKIRDRMRQPWYPVIEQYGLIFAYLGPPDRKPALPRYDILEELEEGEHLETDSTSIGSGGGVIVPCNWLQHYENVMDPFHVPILHGSFSGAQFVAQMAIMPEVTYQITERGVLSTQIRKLDDGRTFRRVTEVILPTLRVVPSPRVSKYGRAASIGWVLPIDDTSFRIYVAGRVREPGELRQQTSRFNGKRWSELTEEEHQRMPGDYEAQTGQGPITFHSQEHLASSDRGVAMLRRVLKQQIEAVKSGNHPLGAAFEASAAMVRTEAGNYLLENAADVEDQ